MSEFGFRSNLQRFRTPLGAILALWGLLWGGLEVIDKAKMLAEYLPIATRVLSSPIAVPSSFLIGVVLIVWQIYDTKRYGEPQKRALKQYLADSFISVALLAALVIVLIAAGAAFSMFQRPVPGEYIGTWDGVLNEFGSAGSITVRMVIDRRVVHIEDKDPAHHDFQTSDSANVEGEGVSCRLYFIDRGNRNVRLSVEPDGLHVLVIRDEKGEKPDAKGPDELLSGVLTKK